MTVNPVGIYTVQNWHGRISWWPKTIQVILVLDTGSSLTWVQYHGCNKCFPQTGESPLPALQSKTFKAIRCHDNPRICHHHICINGVCRYDITYVDGSHTRGTVAEEYFIFVGDGYEAAKTLRFGCGFDQEKIRFAEFPDKPDSRDSGSELGTRISTHTAQFWNPQQILILPPISTTTWNLTEFRTTRSSNTWFSDNPVAERSCWGIPSFPWRYKSKPPKDKCSPTWAKCYIRWLGCLYIMAN